MFLSNDVVCQNEEFNTSIMLIQCNCVLLLVAEGLILEMNDFNMSVKNNNIHVDGHLLFTNFMFKLNNGEVPKCCPKDPPNGIA